MLESSREYSLLAALHELDPTFHAFGTSDRMKGLLKDLGYKQPVPIQSTFIFKVSSWPLLALAMLARELPCSEQHSVVTLSSQDVHDSLFLDYLCAIRKQ